MGAVVEVLDPLRKGIARYQCLDARHRDGQSIHDDHIGQQGIQARPLLVFARLQRKPGLQNLGPSIVKVICNYWYSADSMRAVKMSLDIKYSNGSFTPNSETYELVSAEPSK